MTGTALSAAIASDNAAATAAYPTLTGTAAAAESAALASELSALESAYPSAYASAVPTGPVVDACGPKIPDPSVPDSCSTPVYEVGQPNAWGVQCLNDTGSSTAVNITSCATLIPELCSNQWQSPNQWVWLTADGCSIGSFLPGSNFAGHAPWPSNAQCEELIYASMVDSCQYSEKPWNIAAVNIKVVPTDDTWAGTGEAVNVGYGSYIVAGRQLRTLSDQKDCTWIPRDDYCKGTACYPASYYQSKFQHPTLCAALSSPAATFTPAPKRRRALL